MRTRVVKDFVYPDTSNIIDEVFVVKDIRYE
jgi:hypothetical protein